jgi:HSP20 family protein
MRLHQEMNRLFDDVLRDFGAFSGFGAGGGRSIAGWPQIEVAQTDDGYKLTAELPGMDDKDIELSLNDGVLTLRGEKRAEQGDAARGYSERYYGAFERRIPVGDIDEGKVDATFDRGVLTVALPRSAEAQERVKKIPIHGLTRH